MRSVRRRAASDRSVTRDDQDLWILGVVRSGKPQGVASVGEIPSFVVERRAFWGVAAGYILGDGLGVDGAASASTLDLLVDLFGHPRYLGGPPGALHE